ncbi:MAG: collagen binding domain-containing protein [Blastocatellia bacterium]
MELNRGATIFVGKLVQASETQTVNLYGKPETGHFGKLLFEVIEQFSGTQENTTTVWSQGYGCGGLYHLGELYLVFATPSEEHGLESRNCSTAPVSAYFTKDRQPDNDLKLLRDVGQRKLDGAKISVTVYVDANYSVKSGERDTKYLPNVEVKIEGEGKEITALTDHEGTYRANGLKPGKYVISMVLPDGLLFADGEQTREEITLREYGCAPTGFKLSVDSGLHGIVKDENGKSVAGINVRLFSAELQDQIASEDFKRSLYDDGVVSDRDGKYQFKSILAGQYLIATNFDGATSEFPYPRSFYPQTAEVKKAEAITVEPGKNAGPFDLRLTEKLAARTVQGVVLWPDESPVVGASVRMSLPDDYRSQDEADTDEKGRFILKGLKDCNYEIKVYWHDDEGVSGKIKPSPLGWENATSEVEHVTVTKDIKGLKLVLTKQQR